MFREIQLTNFKSFAGNADPIPLAPVTILVGANASGKSNLFDAFRFLQGIGMELSIAEALTGKWVGEREIHPGIRGGAAEVCWRGENEFSIQTKSEGVILIELMPAGPHRKHPHPTTHRITCCTDDPAVTSETVEMVGPIASFSASPESAGFEVSDKHSLLVQMLHNTDVDDWNRMGAGTCLSRYAEVRFLDVRPSEMKSYVPLAVQGLGAYGENLSAVLYRLSKKPEKWQQYVDWVASLCAPEVKRIEFDKTKTDEVLVMLVEGDGDEKPLSARSISDGTLRFMGILAAMFSAPEGSVFFLEEIENGLHPTRIHLLVELFEQFAESRNLQIIATTHSSQVLLSLSEKAQRDAILFARTDDTPGTITRRLGDLPYFEEVMQKTHIDHLFTTGWLERAV